MKLKPQIAIAMEDKQGQAGGVRLVVRLPLRRARAAEEAA
jgi:hypothetical protein